MAPYHDGNRKITQKAESTRTAMANQIGTDGALLLAQIDTAAEPWLAEIPAVKTLRAVWADHYTTIPEPIGWQTIAEMPSAADQIVSPYDPDGR
ncbi:hypothetical protein [Herpetosiphon geysericola]|uniref:hypothetical protein n=1 Tax=Herpetosiphon geysericola TaxID=70996 RepID=UPI00128F9311|nr:hypothetical protein [Herpetosiphon geysericola]